MDSPVEYNQMEETFDYNLGYEEAREMVMEVIEEMRDSNNFDLTTLNELEDRIV